MTEVPSQIDVKWICLKWLSQLPSEKSINLQIFLISEDNIYIKDLTMQ